MRLIDKYQLIILFVAYTDNTVTTNYKNFIILYPSFSYLCRMDDKLPIWSMALLPALQNLIDEAVQETLNIGQSWQLTSNKASLLLPSPNRSWRTSGDFTTNVAMQLFKFYSRESDRPKISIGKISAYGNPLGLVEYLDATALAADIVACLEEKQNTMIARVDISDKGSIVITSKVHMERLLISVRS
jgi:hypothetical protein